jgi:phosphoglycolate phosphatase-like HAD superfamily hydrolase
MVGDSVKADIEGARHIGMRAVLVRRTGDGLSSPLQHLLGPGFEDVPVITSLAELPALLLAEPCGPNPACHAEARPRVPGRRRESRLP